MRALFAIMFIAFAAVANAGTVTLTGTCPSSVVNGSANFMLNNSGNESATNLVITLHFIGNVTSNRSVQVSSIGPSQGINATLPVSGNGSRGTFGSYFLVAYSQDSSVFSAIFPCLIDVGNGTASQVLVQSGVVRDSGNSSTVKVTLVNGGYGTVNASVDLVLPLGIAPLAETDRTVSVSSTSKNSIGFPISYAGGSGSYTGAVVASYQDKGVNYATLSAVAIDTNSKGSGIMPGTILEYAVIAVVVLFLLLIGRSLLSRRRRPSASN